MQLMYLKRYAFIFKNNTSAFLGSSLLFLHYKKTVFYARNISMSMNQPTNLSLFLAHTSYRIDFINLVITCIITFLFNPPLATLFLRFAFIFTTSPVYWIV